MEPREDLFERLSDDLVANILERLLWRDPWRPQEDGETKAADRLSLELACKRFRYLVSASGNLDLKIGSGLQRENGFVRYMLTHEANAAKPLTRMALEVEFPDNLSAVLSSLIPEVRESLEEFHLFIYHIEAPGVNWETVFVLLQDCKKLERLHITLWSVRPCTPEYIQLQVPSSLKLFPRLRSLVLLGFGVSPDDFPTFISCFPQLELLELHWVGKVKYESNPGLQKLYWWGYRWDGFDKEGPQALAVPSSLSFLVNALGSEAVSVRKKAATLLRNLSYCGEYKRPIAQAPGCLRRLVTRSDSYLDLDGTRLLAVNCLSNLTCNEENAKVIASFPRCLHALVKALADEDLYLRIYGALALFNVASVAGSLEAVAGAPEARQRLVGLLDDQDSEAREHGANALGRLASDPAAEIESAHFPYWLPKLVNLLADANYTVRMAATAALGSFQDASKAVLGAPDALKNLVDLLVEEIPDYIRIQQSVRGGDPGLNLRIGAGKLLEKLSADVDVRARAVQDSALIERLTDFSKSKAPPCLSLLARKFLLRVMRSNVTG